jgi:hypothetical protein
MSGIDNVVSAGSLMEGGGDGDDLYASSSTLKCTVLLLSLLAAPTSQKRLLLEKIIVRRDWMCDRSYIALLLADWQYNLYDKYILL